MPSVGYNVSNVFAAQTGPIPLNQLDANYNQTRDILNALTTFSNYFLDAGAVNAMVVTVPAPLTFAYATGVELQVRVANANTATAITINVNGLGAKTILQADGSVPAVGSILAGAILDIVYDGTNFRILAGAGQTLFPAPVTFTANYSGIGTEAIRISAALPLMVFAETDQGLDGKFARIYQNGGIFIVDVITDAGASARRILAATRVAAAVTALEFGNATDNPTFEFLGTSSVTVGGAVVVNGTSGIVQTVASPQMRWINTAAAVNETYWRMQVSATAMQLQTRTDVNGTGAVAIAINRVGTAISSVTTGDAAQFLVNPSTSFTAPPIAWDGDADTGFYRPAANIIGVTLGGTVFGRFEQGSFSPAYTGFATPPTGTIDWQRVGNLVIVNFNANNTAGSNASTMTITNWPAAIRPSTTSAIALVRSLDTATGGSGSITISTAGVATCFYNAAGTAYNTTGTKGFTAGTSFSYFLN